MKKFLIGTCIVGSILVLLGAGVVVGLFMWASKDLPNFTSIRDYRPPLVTTVYTDDNRVLGYFYKEKRFLVGLTDMPEYLSKAFLAAEDENFYNHEGVDPAAIIRAQLKNMKAGRIKQGGSTITQQIIKRLLLTPEKSYKRKLKEAILAYRLEKYLSKDEILTIYLNQIYLGAGAYGVEAASRLYFGTHVQNLTLAQAAIIAGLPQAPSRYNPYRHPEAARKRQLYVLTQMLDNGWITQEEHDQAIDEPLIYKSVEDPSWQQGAYYLEEVRRFLVDKYGEQEVYEGGMKVWTPCNMEHQVAAEISMKEGLQANTRRRGWHGPIAELAPEQYEQFLLEEGISELFLEPGERLKVLVTKVTPEGAVVRFGTVKGYMAVKTMGWARTPNIKLATDDVPSVKDATRIVKPGDVVWASIVRGPEPEKKETLWQVALQQEPDVEGALVSMKPDTGEVIAIVGGYDFGKSQFNRATQAKRQPGSTFKPIVYSTALDNGYTPATVVLDAPIVYTDYENDHVWKPENFSGRFFGPTILRTALAQSRNLVTIRVAKDLGIPKIIERAKALGMESDFPNNLSVALGSSEVTLINLCKAFSTFARGGSYVKPRLVLRIEDAWGDELYKSEVEATDAIDPATAYVITGMMREVVRDGSGWRARQLKRPVAGKTGTSNEERSAWFMGFTPYLLTGVFVGFDDNRPMGKWETGSRAASSIWTDYRLKVEAAYSPVDFPKPPGVTMVRIDGENGLLAGSDTKQSYFLPFKSGTEPTKVSQGQTGMKSEETEGEDLGKELF